MHDHQDVGRGLFRHDAQRLRFRRQTRQRAGDPVLHLHFGPVRIDPLRERQRQGHATVGGRLRGHVDKTLNAGDLLFQRRGDSLRDHLRTGAGIAGGHHDRGRRDLGIFGQRQPQQAQRAGDDDQHGDHDGEDRAADKIVGNAHRSAPRTIVGGGAGRAGVDIDRSDQLARPDAVQRADDDAVVRRQPVANGAQPVNARAKDHRTVFDDVVPVQHQDEVSALIGADGALGDQQGLARRAQLKPHASEQARRQTAVRIGKHGANSHRSRASLDCVVDEVNLPAMREACLSLQLDDDFRINGAVRVTQRT